MENKVKRTDGHGAYSKNTNKKDKYSQSNEVDNGVLDNLENIIKEMESQGSSRNYQSIIEFFRKGFVNQVVQTWSYYAQTNNHAKTSHATSLLVKTLRILSSYPDTLQHGTNLIQVILTNYAKVLYRGLNNQRPQITNPTIRLMKEIVLFNDSQHLESFLAYFDLSLPSLPRILVPTKSDLEGNTRNTPKKNYKIMRETLLDFWILLISKTPALARRDLLTDNSKIMANWFKYMDKIDSNELLDRSISLFINSILKEPFFKRTTKCKILNELTLSKLHHFYYSQDKHLTKKVNQFFVIYGSSPEFSIAYPDNSMWFEESPFTGSSTGASLTVHQKEFKLHNKLLFNLLKIFKPWEDDLQSSTTIKILRHTPELVAPYCTHIASLGSHDPKMTSYWFGMTLLLGRIINLEVPEFMKNIQTDLIPSDILVIENIIPSSLKKSALTNALQDDHKIIRQLACQMIVFSFQKLDKILDLYTQKGWGSAKATISSMFLNSIPDLNIFTSVLTNLYSTDKDNKILVLSITTILSHYSKTFPNFFSISLPTPNIFTDIMEMKSFTGMDLSILDQYLQFQKFNTIQMKWWNATPSQNSLFCSLLKLASSKNSTNIMTFKIHRLLSDLLHGSIIFNKDLLVSPVLALISSLQVVSLVEQDENEMNKIWKLLDESISRCMKTVYKYVDMSQEFNYVSPFVLAAVDQWQYVKKDENSDLISKWICIFFRSLVFIGESEDGIKSVVKKRLNDIPEDLRNIYLNFSESNIRKLSSSEYLLDRTIESSYGQFLTLSSCKEISASQRIPVNDLDSAIILTKLRQYTIDEDVSFDDTFRTCVDDLCSKLANYYISNENFNILDKRVYMDCLNNISSSNSIQSIKDKSAFIMTALTQISLKLLKEENLNNKAFIDFVFKWILDNKSLLNSNNQLLNGLLSNLINTLDGNEMIKLIDLYVDLDVHFVNLIMERLYNKENFEIEYNLVITLLEKYFNRSNSVIGNFIKDGRIISVDSKELLSRLILEEKYNSLLLSFIDSKYFIPKDVELYLSKLQYIESKVAVAIGLSHMNYTSDVTEEFIKETTNECYNNYKSATETVLASYFELFAIYAQKYLTENQNMELLEYATVEYKHKFNNVVIDLVCHSTVSSETSISKWLSKMTLYITRILTERDELSDKYNSVIKSFTVLIKSINLWENVNSNIINSQLEAIFSKKWILNTEIMEYALLIVASGKTKFIQSNRLVQFILNNEVGPFTEFTSETKISYLIISTLYALFIRDPSGNSNVTVQKKLLTCYSGSISSGDRLILRMLETIESNISLVWTNHIYTWDFMENDDEETIDLIGNTRLIVEEKEGLILTLKKGCVNYSTINYKIQRPPIPEFSEEKSNVKILEKLENFYKETERILIHNKINTIYDPLFLLLVTVHNDELVSEKSSTEDADSKHFKFNVQKYLSSGLFQYIVGCLADNDKDIVKIAMLLLTQMMHSLEENQQFKDGNIFKILLKKIIYTFNNSDDENNENSKIVPAIWYSLTRICHILLHPTTPLYEKAYKWVLNGPLIRSNDIPMLYELISQSRPDINFENYFSQLAWVLKTLEDGIRSEEDVDFLNRRSVMEWLSNISNIPYLNASMHSMINSITYKIQRINNCGSTLITRFGSISDLELKKMSIDNSLNEMTEKNKSGNYQNNNKIFKRELILKEQKLNTEELLQGHILIIQSQKRLVDWTSDDSNNILKRVCRE